MMLYPILFYMVIHNQCAKLHPKPFSFSYFISNLEQPSSHKEKRTQKIIIIKNMLLAKNSTLIAYVRKMCLLNKTNKAMNAIDL